MSNDLFVNKSDSCKRYRKCSAQVQEDVCSIYSHISEIYRIRKNCIQNIYFKFKETKELQIFGKYFRSIYLLYFASWILLLFLQIFLKEK